MPDIDGRGVKVGIDEHGPPIDPDTDDRIADAASDRRARELAGAAVPGAGRARRSIETRVCQYENTSNGDFLIDRHPDYDNVWIVGGGSGHGFKHGPAVGELAARHGAAPASRRTRDLRSPPRAHDARRAIY